jgi:hypothetical protein
VGLEFELKSFELAKQMLYHFSHTSSTFCSGYFGIIIIILNYLPSLASNLDPPDLSLPSS